MQQVAIKIRIYPDLKQIEQINATIDSVRFIFNKFLSYSKFLDDWDRYQYQGLIPNHRKLYPFLKRADTTALQNAVKDLDEAYQGLKKHKRGFPNFKKKKTDKPSYRSNNVQNKKLNTKSIELFSDSIKLPKLGHVKVKFKANKKFDIQNENINSATVTRQGDKYYVSVQAKVDTITYPSNSINRVVGIDAGIKNYMTLSDGTVYDMPDFKPILDRIAKLQRYLANKVKDSLAYRVLKDKINRLHEKIKNIRNDVIHKLTSIISDNQTVKLEDLNVSSMTSKGNRSSKQLRTDILQQGWRMFRDKLKYKQGWRGHTLHAVDPAHTSQMCSKCGYTSRANRETRDEFVCQACDHTMDADHNAAINIKNKKPI